MDGGHELVLSVLAAYRDGRGRRGPGGAAHLGEALEPAACRRLRMFVLMTVATGGGHGHSRYSVSQENTAIRDTMRGLRSAVNPERRISPGRPARERPRAWRQYCCAMPNDRVERSTSVQSVNRAISILQVLARHGTAQVT